MNFIPKQFVLLVAVAIFGGSVAAQPVTGVWRGKVVRGSGLGKQTYKLEVKLVKNGDSLTGTAYYYASANHYFRYAIKGFFGTTDNSVSWWDDQLIESRVSGLRFGHINSQPMLSVADFNCPGNGVMKLDGNTHPKEGGYAFEIHLDKYVTPDFKDEWDPLIENYFYGGADPYLIDSVRQMALTKPVPLPAVVPPAQEPVKETTVYQPEPVQAVSKPVVITQKEPTPVSESDRVQSLSPAPSVSVSPVLPVNSQPRPVTASRPPSVEEKFAQRKKVLVDIIPVTGDSIEFRFYDNAEVDGDSISVFLNQKLLYTHLRLTDKGYSIRIPATALGADNELVMVAENLGSIPPNTAYMEAWSGGKRYTARMESTELSSAMIRLKKE